VPGGGSGQIPGLVGATHLLAPQTGQHFMYVSQLLSHAHVLLGTSAAHGYATVGQVPSLKISHAATASSSRNWTTVTHAMLNSVAAVFFELPAICAQLMCSKQFR